MGHIYKKGNKYYLKYYQDGKPIWESTHSDKRSVAERLLKKREGEIALGKTPGVYLDRIRFEDLASGFLADYEINSRSTLDKAKRVTKRLKESFEGARASRINTTRIKEYVQKRLSEGAANATINRELAALKRMFNLAREEGRIDRIPHIPMLKEDNVRKGFFEHNEYLRLLKFLPDYFRPVFVFGYHTGWRAQEILSLTWEKVDLHQGIVRLDPGETKNEEGRTCHLTEELKSTLRSLFINRRLDCPYVFSRSGSKIGRYDKVWKTACRKAGLRGKLFHDLRRTAVRNLIRSGIPEHTAMKMTGHKTRSVFDRYDIVSEADLREGAKKYEAYIRAQSGERSHLERSHQH